MKRTMKQPPQCMSFTLTFPRLGKAFNYCEMIGSRARWWNNLVLSGNFIQFHRVGNNARGVSPWWNYFLLSPLRFMQKVQFCWHGALINVHDILMKHPLRLALERHVSKTALFAWNEEEREGSSFTMVKLRGRCFPCGEMRWNPT